MTSYYVGKIIKSGKFGDGLITGYKEPDITWQVASDYYVHILVSSIDDNIELVRGDSDRYNELLELDFKWLDVEKLYYGMK